MDSRRHPLDKQTFGEGVRQKWCAVFCAIGLVILALTSFGILRDPAPFLTFFTGIGVTFILGASADSVMKAYKVESQRREARIETVERQVRPRDFEEWQDEGRGTV